jgi:hypothetical protein
LAYQLAYERLLLYDSSKSGITIPVFLQIGKLIANIDAKLDTGSTHCIFQRFVGNKLGLDIESGYQIEVRSINGSFIAYGHNVTLTVLDFTFDSLVYFAKDENFIRDVLGRQGFLNKVQIGIRDYQGELYLSRNDS